MKDNFDLNKLKQGSSTKINSKKKGNKFENDICKLLNEKFDTKEFCRSPGSGAFATTHTLPEHLQVHGDIITPKDFKFCIECKKGYNNLNIHDLLNRESLLHKFMSQAYTDAIRAHKVPLVIWKKDHQKPIFFYMGPRLCINDITLANMWVMGLLEDFLKMSNVNFFLKEPKTSSESSQDILLPKKLPQFPPQEE